MAKGKDCPPARLRIHVDGKVIRQNCQRARDGVPLQPPWRVQVGGGKISRRAFAVEADGPLTGMPWGPPQGCGFRVYLETYGEVRLLDADGNVTETLNEGR